MSADGVRRTEILDTAAELFASSGLKTSLKEIAEACGIQPGSLYHHFESKEAIIVELVDRYRSAVEALAAGADAALATTDDVAVRVVELGRDIAALSTRHRAAVLFTLYEAPSGAGDDLARIVAATTNPARDAMRRTLEAGRTAGYIRDGIDVDVLANRITQVLEHVGLAGRAGVRPGVPVQRRRVGRERHHHDHRRRLHRVGYVTGVPRGDRSGEVHAWRLRPDQLT